ncbi:MAG: hypothetical protein BACD_01524 [Bacteroides rodentium]
MNFDNLLSWSHYKGLLTVTNPETRAWYLKDSQYYERLLLSHDKDKVETEMKSLTRSFEQDKLEFIKIHALYVHRRGTAVRD